MRIIAAVVASPKLNIDNIASIFALVKETYDMFVHIVNRSLKTGHAEILKAKDKIRDDAFRVLRDAVLANSHRLNETSRKYANLLI